MSGIRSVTPEEVTEHLRELDVYGYTVVRRCLGRELCEEMLDTVLDLWQQRQGAAYEGVPDRDEEDRIVYNLQAKDRRFVGLLTSDVVRHLAMAKLNDEHYRFLPPDVPNYILSYYNARSSGRPLELHIDSHVPSPGDHTWAVQFAFALEASTRENGCTTVVPGSHRSGRFTDRALARTVDVEADAGDLVVWDSRTWHGTRRNATPYTRWVLVATCTRWWVKQSMDMTRSLPEPIYAQLDDEARALLGFCSIPPPDEEARINTKAGYDALRATVADYWR